MHVHESTAPFDDGFTWYRRSEPDRPRDLAPLFVLHGGPGMAHDYVQNLAALADLTGRTIIHYDQIGCGRSSHHPDAPVERWTPAYFVEEFHSLRTHLGIDEYHVLGQSWGGMLGAEIAVRQPEGLRGLMICNSPASMPLWVGEAAKLRDALPDAARDDLAEHEAAGTLDHPDYLDATRLFYERHVCRTVPTPQDFVDSEAQMLADPTVYHTMNGPNEFHVIGTLRDWSVIDRLPATRVPTLVVAGEYDEATPATWRPFVDLIPGATAHVFPGASHCVHLEQPEEFRSVIADFLAQHP
ncbi:proline iminopeptidase-family hydrolase [Microbacterium sp. W4I20]|uniref:proline iminopeptidase-family hydrolase n=1 Tax=Microbacterium sp. W4I20 TaxID=3042262 RepID=UPI002788BEF2|nr:proline iminopeptidase-family hydrolase [Microbacterium sp. W4I20]MDQ0728035.1 L-proline amide hydrolase [Microbacterium sp. W4I20]